MISDHRVVLKPVVLETLYFEMTIRLKENVVLHDWLRISFFVFLGVYTENYIVLCSLKPMVLTKQILTKL